MNPVRTPRAHSGVPKHTTREAWLNRAVDQMRPWFAAIGETVPPVRVSIGFPGGGSARKRIGECWSGKASADGVVSVFISPVIGDVSGPVSILAILVHELVHAAGHWDHKAGFRKAALAIGLQGKMTATTAGPELIERLTTLADSLGAWPGAQLDLSQRPTKKQTTRMIKLACVECAWTCRTSAKMIEAGLPTCHCGGEIQPANHGESENE